VRRRARAAAGAVAPTPGDVSEPPLPTSDPPVETLARPAGPLTFVDEGPRSAKALFAVHGIPGSVRDFRYLAPQLTDSVRFVRIDLPGFGGSAAHLDAIDSLDGRMAALVALADHLGIRSFGVLGHSMGGGTALLAAAQHRERVTALALLASVALRPHRGLSRKPASFRIVGRLLGVPGVRAALLPSVRAAYRRRRFPGADEMDARAFGMQMRAIGAVDFARFRRAVAAGLPPTLVAFARDDHMVEAGISMELAAAIPGARVLAFEEGGHNIQKTRAPELGRALKQLLDVG